MPAQDRTNEFLSCVESIRNRSSAIPSRGNEARQRLISGPDGKRPGGKSEFARMAAGIGKDITGTTAKLAKLAQRTSLPALAHFRRADLSQESL